MGPQDPGLFIAPRTVPPGFAPIVGPLFQYFDFAGNFWIIVQYLSFCFIAINLLAQVA